MGSGFPVWCSSVGKSAPPARASWAACMLTGECEHLQEDAGSSYNEVSQNLALFCKADGICLWRAGVRSCLCSEGLLWGQLEHFLF